MKTKHNDSYPITKLLPNIATIIGLCFGLFALKFAIAENWQLAVGLIMIATFIDAVDGRLARMLDVSSEFGAQLDSLSDFFNFGVAPALVLYMWSTNEVKAIGWAVTLFFVIAQALRLARFNVAIADEEKDDRFFAGVPAPCGAGLVLLPMILTFLFDDKFQVHPFEIKPIYVIAYMAFIGFLMVSRVPTISIKKMQIKGKYIPIFLSFTALLIIGLFVEPWVTLPIIGAAYVLTIPFSVFCYLKSAKTN